MFEGYAAIEYTYTYVYMYIHMCIYIYIYIHRYAHIYVYMYMHTHTMTLVITEAPICYPASCATDLIRQAAAEPKASPEPKAKASEHEPNLKDQMKHTAVSIHWGSFKRLLVLL